MYFLHFTIIHNVVSVQCRNMTRAVCRPGDLPDHPGEPRPYLYPHQPPPPQRKSSVIVRNNRNISSLPSSSPAPAPALVSPCGPPPPRLPASPDSEAGAGTGAGRHRAQHDWLKQLQSLRKIIVKSQNRLLIEFILTQTLLLTLEFFIDTAIQFPNFNTLTIRYTTVK